MDQGDEDNEDVVLISPVLVTSQILCKVFYV